MSVFGGLFGGAKKDPSTDLLELAAQGDLGALRGLIERGARVDSQNHDGFTPLMVAGQSGHLDVIDYLIANGANVNSALPSGQSALATAATHGQLGVVQALLDHGADPNAVNRDTNRTALSNACLRGYAEIAEALISHQADLDIKDLNSSSPLTHATNYVNYDCVKLLLEAGAEVDTRSRAGRTPLMLAAQQGFIRAVELTIRHGADVDATDSDGRCVLTYARECDLLYNPCIELLVDAGADDSHWERHSSGGLNDLVRDLGLSQSDIRKSPVDHAEQSKQWRALADTEHMHRGYEAILRAILVTKLMAQRVGNNATAMQGIKNDLAALSGFKSATAGLLNGNIEPTNERMGHLEKVFERAQWQSQSLVDLM